MMDWILNFVAGLTFISIAIIGLTVVSIMFMRWLQKNTTYTFHALQPSPEHQIDALRDEAIGDMFDIARASRMERNVGSRTESGGEQ